MKFKPCTKTLRWAARRLKRTAKASFEAGDNAAWCSGYGDAGYDLLVNARAIEKAKKGKQ